MADKLSYLKQQRNGYRLNVRKNLDIGQELLAAQWDANLNQVDKTLDKLQVYAEKLDGLNEQIGDLMSDPADLQKELDETSKIETELTDMSVDLRSLSKGINKKIDEDKVRVQDEEKYRVMGEIETQRLRLEQQKIEMEADRIKVQQEQEEKKVAAEEHRVKLKQEHMAMERKEIERKKAKEEEKRSHMKPPELTFPRFNGDILKWREFWDAFEATIHNIKEFSDIEKLNFLNNHLDGDAKLLIKGFQLTATNYPVVVQTLKERFGGNRAAITAHHREIMNLQQSPNQTAKLRATFDVIESHLRSLEALGEDSEQHIFVSMISNKLPQDVLVQLEMQKGGDQEWTTGRLRKFLGIHISAREAAERQSMQGANGQSQASGVASGVSHNQSFGQGNNNRQPFFRGRGNQNQQFRGRGFGNQQARGQFNQSPQVRMPTTGALVNGQQRGGSSRGSRGQRGQGSQGSRGSYSQAQAPQRPCIFCEGNHWNDDCKEYPDRNSRVGKLISLKRCFICLSPDHMSNQCTSTRPCFHCRAIGQHHTSLCGERFPSVKKADSANLVLNASQAASEVPGGMSANCSLGTNKDRKTVMMMTASGMQAMSSRQKSSKKESF